MFEELQKVIDSLTDQAISALISQIINDSSIKEKLLYWPAGKTIHHSYTSGLLEHILSCTKIAAFLSSQYDVNENYVIAGTILHDIMKIEELGPGPLHDYTTEGKLVGHVIMMNDLLELKAREIPNFPADVKMHLKHIILSHHGELSYGAPKPPMTKEAMLVHLVDLIDSKMASFESAIKSDKNSGEWTGFIQHLDRVIFKGSLPKASIALENNDLEKLREKFKK